MAEALFTINLSGELISARYYTIDDDLLNRKFLDERLVKLILKRSGNPKKYEQSFDCGDVRIDILGRNDWRVDFFVSRNEPVSISPKNLIESDRVTFH